MKGGSMKGGSMFGDSNAADFNEGGHTIWSGAEQGPLRLFPLPGFVMFPHVAHPFHLFEPRYLAMAKEALQDDQLIAFANFMPGWESDYELSPPIHSTVCVGRISAHATTEQGTLNVIVRGLTRATIIEEVADHSLFRRVIARRDTVAHSINDGTHGHLHGRLLARLADYLLAHGGEREDVETLSQECCDLPRLTDIVTFSMVESFDERRALLAEFDAVVRAKRLLSNIAEPDGRAFPPRFSDN
jgi:Lon protease-like protein